MRFSGQRCREGENAEGIEYSCSRGDLGEEEGGRGDVSRCLLSSHPSFRHAIFRLAQCSPQNVRAALADANKVLASSAPEAEKEEARIEVDVFEGLQAALAK